MFTYIAHSFKTRDMLTLKDLLIHPVDIRKRILNKGTKQGNCRFRVDRHFELHVLQNLITIIIKLQSFLCTRQLHR